MALSNHYKSLIKEQVEIVRNNAQKDFDRIVGVVLISQQKDNDKKREIRDWATDICNNIGLQVDKVKRFYNILEQEYNNYKILYDEFTVNSNLKNKKIIEYEKINLKLESYKQHNNRDNRLSIYEEENSEYIKWIYGLIIILYYGVFILFLIFSKFFSEKIYKNKLFVIMIIIYLIIPIILKYILNIINNIGILIQEKYELKEPTLSYEDIIRYEDLKI
jgi:hypothetical protein